MPTQKILIFKNKDLLHGKTKNRQKNIIFKNQENLRTESTDSQRIMIFKNGRKTEGRTKKSNF